MSEMFLWEWKGQKKNQQNLKLKNKNQEIIANQVLLFKTQKLHPDWKTIKKKSEKLNTES